jgi:hypothetical protein
MTTDVGTTPSIGPVAYFSMEIAIADALLSSSGGLGVLAGDHLRSAADLELPVVGVTLLLSRRVGVTTLLPPAPRRRRAPVRVRRALGAVGSP